jgi:hypothetical protein
MSKEENKRREALTPAMQERERAWEETRMPISKPDLLALVMRLDEVVFAERDGEIVDRCDCTLHYVRTFRRYRQQVEAAAAQLEKDVFVGRDSAEDAPPAAVHCMSHSPTSVSNSARRCNRGRTRNDRKSGGFKILMPGEASGMNVNQS